MNTASDASILWHYSRGAEKEGPVSREQIAGLARAGIINRQTLVWTAGMATWAPISGTPLFSVLQGAGEDFDDLAPRSVGFGQAVARAFSKYGAFDGRASRSEFWYFALFVFLGNIVGGVVDVTLFADDIFTVGGIFSLVVLLPELAVGVRRLHDTGRSGWWVLLAFIPLIGTLWLVILCCQPGKRGTNRFGFDKGTDLLIDEA